jgi:hypothetical protein
MIDEDVPQVTSFRSSVAATSALGVVAKNLNKQMVHSKPPA